MTSLLDRTAADGNRTEGRRDPAVDGSVGADAASIVMLACFETIHHDSHHRTLALRSRVPRSSTTWREFSPVRRAHNVR